MTEERAKNLLEEAIHLFGGIPEDVAGMIKEKEDQVFKEDDNSFYARLGCLVGWGCLWENGGAQNTRAWLGAIGATSEETEKLLAEFNDLLY